jgi:hypothetical protein
MSTDARDGVHTDWWRCDRCQTITPRITDDFFYEMSCPICGKVMRLIERTPMEGGIMAVDLGAGWQLVHLTDRSIELRKDDATYRQIIGRDGYVRVRGEPGLDRQSLIDRAVAMAHRNDELLAERVAKQLVPRRLGGYQMQQRRMATAFGTPEDLEVIGAKRG